MDAWPSPSVYSQAVQVPSLLDSRLAPLRFLDGFMVGLPLSFSGANAVVFAVEDGSAGMGLRFFTNEHAASPARYRAIGARRGSHGLEAFAGCEWIADAITVDGTSYPGLLMEWIDGVLLDQYVVQLAEAGSSGPLRSLADDLRDLVVTLQRAGVAHGDLQHGNVLVERSTGRLRLVDLDSVWLPELADHPPADAGHPSYQHPGRASSGAWGVGIDTVAALILRTSLLALADNPALRSHTVEGSHILLSDRDLKDASQGARTIIDELAESRDRDLAGSAEELRAALIQVPAPDQLLEELTDSAATPVADREWWAADGKTVDSSERHETAPADGFVFRVPTADRANTSEAVVGDASSTRPLPDVAAVAERHRASADTADSGGHEPPTGRPHDAWWDDVATGTDVTTGDPPWPCLDRHQAGPAPLWRRMVAGVLDLVVIVAIVSSPFQIEAFTRGETLGKRWLGLSVSTASSQPPSTVRLVTRELVLKFLPLGLVVLGLVADNAGLAYGAAAAWLLAALPAVASPSARPLWDVLCQTQVTHDPEGKRQ